LFLVLHAQKGCFLYFWQILNFILQILGIIFQFLRRIITAQVYLRNGHYFRNIKVESVWFYLCAAVNRGPILLRLYRVNLVLYLYLCGVGRNVFLTFHRNYGIVL